MCHFLKHKKTDFLNELCLLVRIFLQDLFENTVISRDSAVMKFTLAKFAINCKVKLLLRNS